MPQNVQRGMVRDDEGVFRRQIAELLANPRVGPLSAATIAVNLGVAPQRIFAALEALISAGRLVRAAPDAYTAPPVVDGKPLRPYPRLAPAATPPSIPEALRGDWLLVGGVTGNAEDAEVRGARGEQRAESFTTEETEGTEDRERAEGERSRRMRSQREGREGREGGRGQRATTEDAEDEERREASDERAT